MTLRRADSGRYVPSRSCCRSFGHKGRKDSGNSAMVIPSGPGAPRFAFTCLQARSRLASSTTCSIRFIVSESKAGFSVTAAHD